MKLGTWAWPRSLRVRLLAATLAALAVAGVLAGLLLQGLFREHVQRQQQRDLQLQLDQLTARLAFDAQGRPLPAGTGLSDPRWAQPYGGLYWQIDALDGGTGPAQPGVQRSRSLWDQQLQLPDDRLADGSLHQHRLRQPALGELLVLERMVRAAGSDTPRWRLVVAGDLRETEAAVGRFTGALAASLAVLLALLAAAALAQVALGLAPLRALDRGLADVKAGRSARLEGRYPLEVQPLVDSFNSVLGRNAEVVARARSQAGNLAHALKTPLAVLEQAAGRPDAALPALVQEQVGLARRHIDWHLARSRAAAAEGLPGLRVALAPLLAGLQRVLSRVHAERALTLDWHSPASAAFAGEAQDLQEILGNVLDNACRWARSRVQLRARLAQGRLLITIDDDGPGIAAERRQAVLARGARLDESLPGSGLGLAIVDELVQLYHGRLQLEDSPLGGLRLQLELPAAGG